MGKRNDEEFTWEPWANVRNNEFLIKFLKNHPEKKVQKLVPKGFFSDTDQV